VPHSPAFSFCVRFPATYAGIVGPPFGYRQKLWSIGLSSGRRGLGRVSAFTDTDDTHNNYH